jgi:hypothetical protein
MRDDLFLLSRFESASTLALLLEQARATNYGTDLVFDNKLRSKAVLAAFPKPRRGGSSRSPAEDVPGGDRR